MKAQLVAEQVRVAKMLERAETLADSDNETTATRYENVVDALQAALDAIEEAVALFD